MKLFKRFLLLVFCAFPAIASAQVASTLGSNLTAYNPGSGSTNNNNWNSLMNSRSGTTNSAKADFGNCNSLILRCAQPKCSGCTSLDLARPIVAGCVNSNEACKQYGDDLVEYISAQLVSNATARAQEQELAAQSAAAQAAAQQNSQQMAQMQAQMQQMQQQMQQQNSETIAQLQAALEEQKAINAQAIADATAAQQAQSATTDASTASGNTTDLSDAQIAAAQSGVSDDILAREKISGQILTKIENAEVALKTLKATMQNAFDYAGCDSNGNNCVGPKRVKTFKNKALQFFDPYNDVLDELYDALITAQAVGVDITDIYMMLNGSCNVWGEYLCSDTTREKYDDNNCPKGQSVRSGITNGGHECYAGQVIPAEDSPACVLQRTLKDQEEVQRNWLYAETGDQDDMIRVGCASAALETSTFFRGRKKQATIDIETLERIIEQDAPEIFGGNRFAAQKKPDPDAIKYCAVGVSGYQELQKAASTKGLPKKVCVKDAELQRIYANGGPLASGDGGDMQLLSVKEQCKSKKGQDWLRCLCEKSPDNEAYWDTKGKDCKCVSEGKTFYVEMAACMTDNEKKENEERAEKNEKKWQECFSSGGVVNYMNRNNDGDICLCDSIPYNPMQKKCSPGTFGIKTLVDRYAGL